MTIDHVEALGLAKPRTQSTPEQYERQESISVVFALKRLNEFMFPSQFNAFENLCSHFPGDRMLSGFAVLSKAKRIDH